MIGQPLLHKETKSTTYRPTFQFPIVSFSFSFFSLFVFCCCKGCRRMSKKECALSLQVITICRATFGLVVLGLSSFRRFFFLNSSLLPLLRYSYTRNPFVSILVCCMYSFRFFRFHFWRRKHMCAPVSFREIAICVFTNCCFTYLASCEFLIGIASNSKWFTNEDNKLCLSLLGFRMAGVVPHCGLRHFF